MVHSFLNVLADFKKKIFCSASKKKLFFFNSPFNNFPMPRYEKEKGKNINQLRMFFFSLALASCLVFRVGLRVSAGAVSPVFRSRLV